MPSPTLMAYTSHEVPHTQQAQTYKAAASYPAPQHAESASPTQFQRPLEHVQHMDMSTHSPKTHQPLAHTHHSSNDCMTDVADSTHSFHSHKELRVDTARTHSTPSVIPVTSSAIPPATSELPTQQQTGAAEPASAHSAHSQHSSSDSSATARDMYQHGADLAINSSAASSGTDSSSDGSNCGATSSQQQDHMQISAPHSVTINATAVSSQQHQPPSALTGGMASASAAAMADHTSAPSTSSSSSFAAQQQSAGPSSSYTPAAMQSSPMTAEAESAASAVTPPAGAGMATPASAAATEPQQPRHSRNSSSSGRYKPIRTLQNSLFGQVQLAFDTHKGVEVAVKVSHAELVAPKSQTAPGGGVQKSAAGGDAADVAATARSQAGVSVLEDVRREARILRLLMGPEQPPLTTAAIDNATCGLSNALLHAIHLPANAVVQPGATNPLTIKQQFLDSISKGRKSIADFYDEVEAENFHYLISQYLSGGDLFSVLTAQPQHKVSEAVARLWFYSLACSVRYLHAHSIAHLDLSLENICMDAHGHIRLIDFGLAAQHPAYAGDKRTYDANGNVQRNASHHIKLLHEAPANPLCECAACKMTQSRLLAEDPAIQAALRSGVPLSKLKYLCRPVCQLVHKPGKLGYMSPELYNNHSWDSYGHDCFGLGVILYSMLTGRPPFTRPDAEADVWFKVIYSGQWLMQQVRSQAPAQIYNNLSPNALHLIDLLLKPQHLRPSIDTILKHPWLSPNHPGNAVPAPPAPVKTSLGRASHMQMAKGGKPLQRRGSE